MQNDFEARHIKNAKEGLLKDLEIAEQNHTMQKERQIELARKATLWEQVKGLFNRFF